MNRDVKDILVSLLITLIAVTIFLVISLGIMWVAT